MNIRQPIVTVAGHVDHGKCVSGDTIIPLVDGSLIKARDLFEKHFDKIKAKKIEEDIIQKTDNITLFSNFNNVILPAKVSHIWKRKRNKLIEIKTAHGDILKTTFEHPYFRFSLQADIETRAEDLKVGDYIAVTKKIKIRDLFPRDLLITELKKSNFLCFLNRKSEKLFSDVKSAGITKIERKISIKHLNDSIKKSKIRIQSLFKLGKYFRFSDIELYNMIEGIKNSSEKQRAGHTSKIIRLPDLHELEKLGYVLGCIAGDGHLSKTQVLLDNNDKEIQEKYSEYLKEIFDLNSFVKQNHTCQTVINEGGLTFKKFIKEIIGFPDKQKSANIEVPRIAQTNKEIFRGFFAGLLDTDGYISHINYSIELTSKSENLIRQCSILLLNFSIQSVVYEKDGFFVLRIANKKYLTKFIENFRPRLTRKLKRIINALEKAQSSRIFDMLPVSQKEIKDLNLPGKINKLVPYFNKYLKYQNFSESFLRQVLNNVKKENLVSEKIRGLLDRELCYVKIISKKEVKNKEEYVYDFTVPETHNFIAQRTLVHNTSILDKIRGTSIQEGESGGITQKISFTTLSKENIKKRAGKILEKFKIPLEIPGLLFIDTPGHAAFTNLRKRGGSLADIAVLVIDINDGIKPQTAEVLQILKANKTPFIIALNKIDNISGWQTSKSLLSLEAIENQALNVKQNFEEKFYTLIGVLHSYGFNAEMYSKIKDFTQNLAIIPCSAKTGEGISEILAMITALSQKFLQDRIKTKEQGKGVILEVKKDKAINFLECILYDGKLSDKDEIAIASIGGKPIITKVRNIQEAQEPAPTKDNDKSVRVQRAPTPNSNRSVRVGSAPTKNNDKSVRVPLNKKFKTETEVKAATGIRLQIVSKEEILPGMPFQVVNNNLEEIKEEFSKEISEEIQTDKTGIVVKADSLGSLEALLFLLKQKQIRVIQASIGPITKKDVYMTNTLPDEDKILLGFNVQLAEDTDVKELKEIKIITDSIIYKLIENLEEWRENKLKETERQKIAELPAISKITILNFVFRNSNPAVFGVKVEGGILKKGERFINKNDEKIGQIKEIQEDKNNVQEATKGKEVAISIPGVNFERQLKTGESLYTNLSETEFRKFKKYKDLLTSNEKSVLQEIATIKRKSNSTWGL